MSLWLKSADNVDENNDSDSSDEDYVPGDAPDVSEEEEDGDDEPVLDNNEGSEEVSSSAKSNSKRKRPRKRNACDARESASAADIDAAREDEAKRLKTEAEQEKLRADKLFADFMSDVGRPRDRVKQQVNTTVATSRVDPVTPATVSSGLASPDTTGSIQSSIASSSPSLIPLSPPNPLPPQSVANSEIRNDISPVPTNPPADNSRTSVKLSSCAVAEVKSGPPAPSRRRAGGLSALVGSINKPAKMNVLQRSSLDWDRFKEDTGAHEELQQHIRSKDSYLEKQDFLLRTDQRQFEQEKAMRERHRTPRL